MAEQTDCWPVTVHTFGLDEQARKHLLDRVGELLYPPTQQLFVTGGGGTCHRRSPDWADLREMARNAGWTRDRGDSGTTWGHHAFGAILDRRHGMAYVNKRNRRVYLAGPGDDEHRTVVLFDPSPAEILTAAHLVGLIGGAS
jgi:hypothetical protein